MRRALAGAALAVLASGTFMPGHAQQFAEEGAEVPIGTFELQGQGFAVESTPQTTEPSGANDPDSARRWFFQRFELSLRESRDARQTLLLEAEGELKAGRLAAAQRLFERLVSDAPDTEEARSARAHLADLYRPKREPSQAEASQDLLRNSSRVSQAVDEEFLTLAGDRVFFSEGKADLGQRARAVLQAQARYLKTKPELAVVVEGHEDDSVPADEGKVLSEARARVVREMLVSEGVATDRIMIVSKGRDERVAPCDEGQCRAQNRRAVTVLMLTNGSGSRLKSSKITDGNSKSSRE